MSVFFYLEHIYSRFKFNVGIQVMTFNSLEILKYRHLSNA